MDRREFFRRSLGATAAAGSVLAFANAGRLLAESPLRTAAPPFSPGDPFDLVAVKGAEADAMFDKGIEAFGGMGAFVKKGQKVVIKPNIGWDVSPERAGNTNPKLVTRIIQHCLNAGAREVYVFDHTCDNGPRCYRTSGIENAVTAAGGKMAPGHSESYYQEVAVPGAKTLARVKEHELILGSDVFINVPVLKSHSSTRLTIAMKNLMGNVWDRGFWHANDLHLCIAEFAAFRKPDLNVVDAYAVMKRNGPRGVSVEDVVTMKAQLLSRDMVAVDAAATKLAGLQPENVRYIQLAAERGAGRMDLDKLNIKRIAL
jgi:uncharacterized protein (DUF362 family)